ncbi:hypothetical protein FACS1894103_6660 [Campylobacterota bacterium]|nr:hypothetical protein FACS1894103_6660 [Campylobacterota bacterium]
MSNKILSVRILITDDSSDIRAVLRAICRKIEGVELFEAVDGKEAVEMVANEEIDLVLMDLMMPVMDGFEATRRIKESCPNTMVVAITSLIDAETERKVTRIGATGFLRKPITDLKTTRFRIANFVAYIRTMHNTAGLTLRESNAKNPFTKEIRSIKSRVVITTEDELMDLNLWLTERYMNAHDTLDGQFRHFFKLLAETIGLSIKSHAPSSVEIEENFDWIFLCVSLYEPIDENVIKSNYPLLGNDNVRVEPNMLYIRQPLREKTADTAETADQPAPQVSPQISPDVAAGKVSVPPKPEAQPPKTVRQIGTQEQQMLRQSRTEKIGAQEYVQSFGSGNEDEIRDMTDAEEDWADTVAQLSEQFSIGNARKLSRVLNDYSSIVNRLIEFETLAYALTSMAHLIDQLEESALDGSTQMLFTTLMRGLLDDMRKWHETIFVAQSTPDIHYLDSSLLSSCMQIESLLLNQHVATGDDDNDLELF